MHDDAAHRLTQAQALAAQGRWDQASALYRKILDADPRDAEAANGLGAALCMQGRIEEGAACFRRALDLAPAMAKAAANLGGALQNLGQWDDAVTVLSAAADRSPLHPQLRYNLGHAQHHLGRFDQAAASYGRAVELAPRYREAWTNLGVSLRELGRLDEALAALDAALEIDPDHAVSHYNRAFVLLEKGDMRQGWAEHEWRFAAGITPRRTTPAPLWQGEDMAGKTLLAWAEQGFGDTVQFVRFLPLAAARGARVVCEVQAPLVRLLAGIPGADEVIAQGETRPHDRHIPLMSLPHVLGLGLDDIPARPYLSPPPAAFIDPSAFIDTGRPRAGLVWSGSPGHKNDRRRSLGADHAARLAAIPGIDWVSLQMGPVPHPPGLPAPPAAIGDFRDTAALAGTLDVIVSVDTAVAHVAAALGLPVWLLLPFAPDWRWLHDRNDSPWYPGMRLFRQPRPGDWDSVIRQVARSFADVPPRNRGQR